MKDSNTFFRKEKTINLQSLRCENTKNILLNNWQISSKEGIKPTSNPASTDYIINVIYVSDYIYKETYNGEKYMEVCWIIRVNIQNMFSAIQYV